MKKIICILAVFFLITIIILNIVFSANLTREDHIDINFNTPIYVIVTISIAILVYLFTKFIDKYVYDNFKDEKWKKTKKRILICILIIYALFNIIWAIMVNPKVVGDSVHVCNLAQTFYRGDDEQFLNNTTYAGITLREYMQTYPHQILTAFVYSIFFRIIHFDSAMEILRILNIIGNILIVIALYKINIQLSKKYKTNKVLLLFLILTFISLPMLVTYIYGDIPRLALCLFSVYFMMRYTETNKIMYPIIASICTMLAYMFRMNSLIFIIATVMYLIFNLFKKFKESTKKENLLNIVIIISYIIIAILPATMVKNYYFHKYNLDKSKVYPVESYFLMAMEESPRANGWYNESIAEKAIHNPQEVKGEYIEKIKDRLNYFSQNIGYAFEFYVTKLASMWTENTYSAIQNNIVNNDYSIEKYTTILSLYQKALLILMCFCSLVVILQNRKNLSLEVIFLLTIFIGGFAFHILWEAKSRYIIPYIVVLIPIASIGLNKIKFKNIFKDKKGN